MKTLIEVKKREENNILIFEFSGELDETNVDNPFKRIYDQIRDFSTNKVIFNMSGLVYLNSKSIGYIANVTSEIEKNNGEMYICNCNKGVEDILELVGISSVVYIVDSEKEAILEMSQ